MDFLALNRGAKWGIRLPKPAGASIPKIIHQTCPRGGEEDFTAPVADGIARLKKLNVGWDHRLYSDEDALQFIRDHYPARVVHCYERINPAYGAARADFFRYLLMYQCGGVYLDIKSSARLPFDEVLKPDDQFLLSQWHNAAGEQFEGWGLHPDLAAIEGGEFQNFFLICVPGHPFLARVIRCVMQNIGNYVPSFHGVGWLGVMRVTGPHAYTLAIEPLLKTCSHRFVDSESDLGLIYSVAEARPDVAFLGVHYSKLTDSVVRANFKQRVLMMLLALARIPYRPLKRIYQTYR